MPITRGTPDGNHASFQSVKAQIPRVNLLTIEKDAHHVSLVEIKIAERDYSSVIEGKFLRLSDSNISCALPEIVRVEAQVGSDANGSCCRFGRLTISSRMDQERDRYYKQNVGASNLGVHGGNFRLPAQAFQAH